VHAEQQQQLLLHILRLLLLLVRTSLDCQDAIAFSQLCTSPEHA
jgi:IS4 transposase